MVRVVRADHVDDARLGGAVRERAGEADVDPPDALVQQGFDGLADRRLIGVRGNADDVLGRDERPEHRRGGFRAVEVGLVAGADEQPELGPDPLRKDVGGDGR